MNSAQDLYDKLVSFKQASDSQSPEQQLLEYCSQTLGTVERIHFDYKQKDDTRNSTPNDKDKKNLAKAVSGFANTGGGVLIWGIENDTLKPKPITNIQKYTSELLKLVAHVTDPLVPDIDGDWIPSDATPQSGFGLILIPESPLPPHRVILNYQGIKNHYYIRTGESFVIASHTMLEDMFGRRPKPKLALSTRSQLLHQNGNLIMFDVVIGIENQGRGTAKAPFLSLEVKPPYKITKGELDGDGRPGLTKIASANHNEHLYGSETTTAIHPGINYGITKLRVDLDTRKAHYQTPALVLNYKIAAEGIQLIEEQKTITGSELWQMVAEAALSSR